MSASKALALTVGLILFIVAVVVIMEEHTASLQRRRTETRVVNECLALGQTTVDGIVFRCKAVS